MLIQEKRSESIAWHYYSSTNTDGAASFFWTSSSGVYRMRGGVPNRREEIPGVPDNTDCVRIHFLEEEEELLVSRDAFGVVPLFFYFEKGRFLAIADNLSELVSFLAENKISVGVNRSFVRRYLAVSEINQPYSEETCFLKIRSFLPGYRYIFSRDNYRLVRCLTFETGSFSRLREKEEYGALFRELFRNSVLAAAGDGEGLSAQVSGGLDSSSVLTMLRHCLPEKRIVSFHLGRTFEPPSKDTRCSREVVEEAKTLHYEVRIEDNDILTGLEKVTETLFSPAFMMGNHPGLLTLFEKARTLGVKMLFTGFDGDSVVGYARNYPEKLFRARRWNDLKRVVGESQFFKKSGSSSRELLSKVATAVSGDLLRRGEIVAFFRSLLGSSIHLGINPFLVTGGILKKVFEWLKSGGRRHALSLYRPDGSEEELEWDCLDTAFGVTGDQKRYNNRVLVTQNIRLSEEYYTLGKKYGVEMRHPFYTPKLYELCLSVPDEIAYHGGLGKGVLRIGMKGILTESVRTRTGKTVSGEDVLRSRALLLVEKAKEYLNDQGEIWKYVDRSEFQRALDLLSNKADYEPKLPLRMERVVHLAVWLKVISGVIVKQ